MLSLLFVSQFCIFVIIKIVAQRSPVIFGHSKLNLGEYLSKLDNHVVLPGGGN